jgi:hypothetical protein
MFKELENRLNRSMAALLVEHETSCDYHVAVTAALEQFRDIKIGVNQSNFCIEFFQKSSSSISSSSLSYESWFVEYNEFRADYQ